MSAYWNAKLPMDDAAMERAIRAYAGETCMEPRMITVGFVDVREFLDISELIVALTELRDAHSDCAIEAVFDDCGTEFHAIRDETPAETAARVEGLPSIGVGTRRTA